MAKKATTPRKTAPRAKSTRSSTPRATSTGVRNTAVPRAAARTITQEQIAQRAYEIYLSGQGGSQQENWLRAERELLVG